MSTGCSSEAEEAAEPAARRPSPAEGAVGALPCPARGAPSGGGRRGAGPRQKSPGGGRRRRRGGAPGGASAGGVQRSAANARERARMRVLSGAFSRLKTTLPWVPPDTKLSKLDTLRLAASYIAHLRRVLAGDQPHPHPLSLTWPFMVAGKPENELKEAVNSTRLCGPTAS